MKTSPGSGSDKQKIYDGKYFDFGITKERSDYSWESKSPYFEAIFATFKNFQPKRVLDIGCAKGFLVSIFNAAGIEAYGVDVSSYAIENTPNNIRNKLFTLDIEKNRLPFENDYFDLVFGLEILEHLSRFDNLLQEVSRVLKKNGYVFFTTPTPNSWDAAHDLTHINIHPRKFWVVLFETYGFLELEKTNYNAFKKEFIKNYKHYIAYMPATRKIASLLLSLGWVGRLLRREMQVYINFFSPWKTTEILILKK